MPDARVRVSGAAQRHAARVRVSAASGQGSCLCGAAARGLARVRVSGAVREMQKGRMERRDMMARGITTV